MSADDPRLDELARRLEQLPPDAWERPTPPAAPWPSDAPRPAAARDRRRFALRPASAAVVAVALLAIGVVSGLLIADDEDRGAAGTAERQVELRPVQGRGRGAAGDVRLEARAGSEASVRVRGLKPSARGDFYELWLLGAKGELVSLGSFQVPASGAASLRVPLPVDPARFRYLDVSREPDDGDPAHSTISILRGPAA
ncbi:MAG TPA: anti-sigma factor [Thermoleophilaceae bacterium]